jgi:phosphopantothenoylcysteine decarboxylase/phosphopantothenate--cysteine ligase
MSKGKILFQLSGSIAGYKACFVISRLVQEGYEVQTVATANAQKFIGAATLEGLTSKAVLTDTFEPGRNMDHINLAKWADLAVLCPATASSINRLASGIAEDVVGSLFLAYDLRTKPYLVFPAMNRQMLAHPATQTSLQRLKDWGVRVMPTDHGHQACGDVGMGRLLEPNQIFEQIVSQLKNTETYSREEALL